MTPSSVTVTEATPFVHLFAAAGRDFALDLHSNRLFSLEPDEAAFLRDWRAGESFDRLADTAPDTAARIDALRAEGVFATTRPERLAYAGDWADLVTEITTRRGRTVLELTQDCNLRCRYCTFGGGFADHRSHSLKRMTPAVLEAAILDALACGVDRPEIGLAFYGGEPLLAFDLLTHGVNFAKAAAQGKPLRFSTTTNGTALDPEKARFLARHGFSVLVSIDGPRVLHDANRVFRNGTGSYDKAIRGLRHLLQAYPPEAQGKIGLSMVAPSAAWIAVLERLWDDEPWLPRGLRVMVADVNAPPGFQMEEPPQGSAPDFDALRRRYLAQGVTAERGRVVASVFDDGLARLHHRPMARPGPGAFFPNGCCIPGATRLHVDAEGRYRLCERAHGTPEIGSVAGGVRLQAVKAVIDAYCEGSLADCRDCPAVSLCTLCFAHAFTAGRFDLAAKRQICARTRTALARRWQDYAALAERPERVAQWEAYEFTD